MKKLSLIILVFSMTLSIAACDNKNAGLPAKSDIEVAVEKEYGMEFEFDFKDISDDGSRGEWVFISEDGTLEVTVTWNANNPGKFYFNDRKIKSSDDNSDGNTKPDLISETDSDTDEQNTPNDNDDYTVYDNNEQHGEIIETSNVPIVAEPVDITYLVTGVSASSEDDESYGNYYYAENIIDGDLDTSWAEGLDDDGIGEYITFNIPKGTLISGLVVHTGYCKSEHVFYNNGAPSVIDVYSGTDGYRVFLDTADTNNSASDFYAALEGVYISFPSVIVSNGKLKVTIVNVRTGESWSDTNMSEITIMGAPAPV